MAKKIISIIAAIRIAIYTPSGKAKARREVGSLGGANELAKADFDSGC